MENAWVPSVPSHARDAQKKTGNDPSEVVCQRRMLTFIDAPDILEITRNDSLPAEIIYLSLETNAIRDAGLNGIAG
jgi:hypothetical protein